MFFFSKARWTTPLQLGIDLIITPIILELSDFIIKAASFFISCIFVYIYIFLLVWEVVTSHTTKTATLLWPQSLAAFGPIACLPACLKRTSRWEAGGRELARADVQRCEWAGGAAGSGRRRRSNRWNVSKVENEDGYERGRVRRITPHSLGFWTADRIYPPTPPPPNPISFSGLICCISNSHISC